MYQKPKQINIENFEGTRNHVKNHLMDLKFYFSALTAILSVIIPTVFKRNLVVKNCCKIALCFPGTGNHACNFSN